VTLVEDRDIAIQSVDYKSSLLIQIPKALTRRQRDMSIERIFSKEIRLKREEKHAIQHGLMLIIVLSTLSKLKHIKRLLMYKNTYYLLIVMMGKYQTIS